MARPLRLEIPGGTYHVTTRGNGKQPIYLDHVDRHLFLRTLERVLSRHRWCCLGYRLMGNHYHLLVETPQPNLSRGMRHLNGCYAQGFNRRHEDCGPLFQGRFGAVLVQRDAHILELARYLALNPVRDGFCRRPEQWRWSSHRAMLGLESPGFVATDALLSHFGTSLEDGRRRYRAFIDDAGDTGAPRDDVVIVGTREFQATHLPTAPPSPEVPRRHWQKPTRPSLTTLIDTHGRDEAIVKAYRDFGYSMREIAQALDCHYATVSRRLRALEAKQMLDRKT